MVEWPPNWPQVLDDAGGFCFEMQDPQSETIRKCLISFGCSWAQSPFTCCLSDYPRMQSRLRVVQEGVFLLLSLPPIFGVNIENAPHRLGFELVHSSSPRDEWSVSVEGYLYS